MHTPGACCAVDPAVDGAWRTLQGAGCRVHGAWFVGEPLHQHCRGLFCDFHPRAKFADGIVELGEVKLSSVFNVVFLKHTSQLFAVLQHHRLHALLEHRPDLKGITACKVAHVHSA